MTATQIPVAATSSTVTSSIAVQGTDTKLLSAGTVSGSAANLCTDANGGATTSGCTSGGSGTVTHSAGALTAKQVAIGNGSADLTVDSVAKTDGIGDFTVNTMAVIGPSPWIDVSTYGAKGDGLYNNTGGTSTTSGTTTLTTSSGATVFAATDCTGGSGCTGTVSKLITIPAGGLATPTLGTISTASGSLTLSHACLQITAIQDNASLPITSGAPSINGESLPAAESCEALTAQNMTMTAPTLAAGATGYRFYFTDETGAATEVSQIIPGVSNAICSSQSAKNIRDGACDPTATLTINAYTYIGFLPPQKAGWLSTIASFTNTRSITLTDEVPSDVTGNTHEVAWGTANDAAYTSALAACPNPAGVSILSGYGCTLYFPPVGTPGSPATSTGRYASQNGLTVLQSGVTVKTSGAVDALPNNGESTLWTNWGTTALWVMGRSWGLQYGNSATNVVAGGVESANIEDLSGVGYGALFATGTSSSTNHLSFRKLYGSDFFSGACVTLGNVQILDISYSGCLSEAGIMGEDFVSNVQFANIELVGTLNSSGAGWAVLLGSNPATTSITGSNQLSNVKVRDFYQGHYRLKNAQETQVFEEKSENIALSGGASCSGGTGTSCYGTLIKMDDMTDSGRCGFNQFFGGTWQRGVSFFNIGANCFSNTVIESGASIFSGTVCTDSGSNDEILVGSSNLGCTNKLAGTLNIAGQILATEPTGSVWGSATGGAKGAGTINAQNLYVNGTAVGTGGGPGTGTQYDARRAGRQLHAWQHRPHQRLRCEFRKCRPPQPRAERLRLCLPLCRREWCRTRKQGRPTSTC